jgi:prolyl oligopeptidase
MKHLTFFALSIMILAITNSTKSADANEQLMELFKRYDEYNLRTNPEGATYEGDHRYDDLLSDNSEEAVIADYDSTRTFLKDLLAIDYSSLTEDNKLNYDLFKRSLDLGLQGEKFHWHYMPLGQQWGIHISFPQLVNYQPLSTYEEYQKYFKRLRGLNRQVDNTIANMKKGMSSGLMPPAFIIEQTPPQMEKVMNADPEKSIFYTLNKENKLTPEEKDKASDELKKIIQNEINPAYKKLYDFVKNEYLPNCRKDAGVWSLPDGQQRYESSVKYFTTLDLTADEIHNIGLKEVERIQKEMITLKDEIGFKGTLDEFNAFLKTDPQFYYTDKNNLMDGFRTILKKMDTKLPDLFGRLPEAKYDLFEMEEFRAKSAPAAYYYSAPVDRSRPGYFYVNTYNLPSRPKYTMTSLALHEAVPGHHLQISIAQELKNLPKFRRELGVTAFVEGWGLYAEHLGYESGMYEDLYQRYGALTFEMWRACRLVVDTGIHEKRWTREQARDFMKKYTPTSDLDIQSEVDRYISWPGQALAYKIGELKLKELRKNAEDRLGSKFNVKEFHDNVLKNGAIPLILLEKKINEWIDSKLNEN